MLSRGIFIFILALAAIFWRQRVEEKLSLGAWFCAAAVETR
jgi:hypothetical protein